MTYCPICGFGVEPCETTQNGDDICGCGQIILYNVPPHILAMQERIKALEAENAELLARAEAAEEARATWKTLADKLNTENADLQNRLDYWRDTAKAAVLELSTLRESMRWIPVSERLPTDDMVDIYEVVCKDIHTKRRYDDEVYWQMSFWEVPDSVVIEYWREIQPIPKPPEDSSDE